MVRKIKSKSYRLDKLAKQEKKPIIEDEFEDLEEFNDEFITLDMYDEEFQENKDDRYSFEVQHLSREECILPTYSKKEIYDKKLTIRIGETEEKIIDYLKYQKGLNISVLLRDYILSLGKEIADENFLNSYNEQVREYNQVLKYIEKCQEYRKKLKNLRGANEFTANILTKQRDLMKFKIKNLKSKAKKINYQLEKMEKVLE